jgi:hypothetical protein
MKWVEREGAAGHGYELLIGPHDYVGVCGVYPYDASYDARGWWYVWDSGEVVSEPFASEEEAKAWAVAIVRMGGFDAEVQS